MEWLVTCDESSDSEDEFKEQLDIDHAIALSLSEQDQKGKKSIDKESQSEDYKHLARAQTKEDEHIAKAQLEDDEQLAKALQESIYLESPQCETEYRICACCNTEIGGEYLTCMDADWHPECFCCHACNCPITDSEFYISGNHSYHKLCYRKQRLPRCEVCKNFIPAISKGRIPYMEHPFWKNKYCPSHEHDGTPRCCSCERMEPRDTRYLLLDDGRKLCLECLHSAIMDTQECQPLYLEIQEFYEDLNMKVEQQVPMLLVERQALNEAMEGEKHGHHHLSETRGLCLSEVQTVPTISRTTIGADHQFIDMRTEPYRLIRRCEVTAILVLYGLPRLLTGQILAHEMMHAWLKLNGYRNLSPEVEEGICQVLAYIWLKAKLYTASGSDAVPSTPSLSSLFPSSSSFSTSLKKDKRSDFEKKCGDFFIHRIEVDASPAYGDGFRKGWQAVDKYGLDNTLEHIRLTGSFP